MNGDLGYVDARWAILGIVIYYVFFWLADTVAGWIWG